MSNKQKELYKFSCNASNVVVPLTSAKLGKQLDSQQLTVSEPQLGGGGGGGGGFCALSAAMLRQEKSQNTCMMQSAVLHRR